ncbi:MAG: HsdM family class I SAM-dependent methyltransferase [Candidatus Polarisedimenticolia bacterium]
MTSLPVHRAARKDLGAFYSPQPLVEPMVRWAIRSETDFVLDPSCGDGVFLDAAAHRLIELGSGSSDVAAQVIGIDLNPHAVSVTSSVLSPLVGASAPDVRRVNFFDVDPGTSQFPRRGGLDVVLGNPPYIRYQGFTGPGRRRALSRASRMGVVLPQLTSSWAPFVVHAASFLRPGGRLAFILPAELVHTSYAAPVREFLTTRFRAVSVISFRRPVFPGVQARVVLVLAEGFGTREGTGLRLVEVHDAHDLHAVDDLIATTPPLDPESVPRKWIPGHLPAQAAAFLRALEIEGPLVPLRRLAKAGIGFVSGANDFFVLTAASARERGLPASSLHSCVVRARQIPGAFLTSADLTRLRTADERCLLWRPNGPLVAAEQRYVRYGESLGLAKRYKCRVRSPWYVVPGVTVPDALLTYMSDTVPRLCLNEASVATTNNLLAVRMHSIPAALRRAFVVAFYNSATLFSVEWMGRQYGGGVLKLEPREADQVLIPALDRVARHREPLEKLSVPLQQQLTAGRGGSIEAVISNVDRIVLGEAHEDLRMADGLLSRARLELVRRRRISAAP